MKNYERPRPWGSVHLILWGGGWIKEEAEKFAEAFWWHADEVVIKLVGEKKFAVINLKGTAGHGLCLC